MTHQAPANYSLSLFSRMLSIVEDTVGRTDTICENDHLLWPGGSKKPKTKSYQTIRLLGSRTTSSAEKMTAFSGFGSKTSSSMTLWTAVDFGKLLTVLWTLSPTTCMARLMTRGAITFWFLEAIYKVVLGVGAGNDLLPLDGLDVAQIVVVHDTHATLKNIWKKRNNS